MKIQIIQTKRLGLEVFKIYVAGVYATEFLSAAQANTYVLNTAARFNKKVGA